MRFSTSSNGLPFAISVRSHRISSIICLLNSFLFCVVSSHSLTNFNIDLDDEGRLRRCLSLIAIIKQ